MIKSSAARVEVGGGGLIKYKRMVIKILTGQNKIQRTQTRNAGRGGNNTLTLEFFIQWK